VANGFLYTAGFRPQDPATGTMVDDVAGQTRQVLKNIKAVLDAHGVSMNDVVKTTVHLQHLTRDFPEFNVAYLEFFSEPYPVRTTVGSTLGGILVEIDVVAVVPG
jgi:2-iminobutanoate/2-iminopropanoate deaminase